MSSSEVKKPFSFPRFLTETISFGALHSALFCTVLIPFLTNSGLLPLQLSIILLARKLVRLLSDSVFGMAFDKFGPKPVFLIGRLLKLSAYFLFLLPASFETYLLAVLVSGVSYSSIYGKVGAYIYNTLSAIQYLCAHDPKAAGAVLYRSDQFSGASMRKRRKNS